MCRLQATPPRCFDFQQAGVSHTEFFQPVGNAMSANVLARLFDRRAPHAAVREGAAARWDLRACVLLQRRAARLRFRPSAAGRRNGDV
jgi:hypothetical protein